MSAVRPLPEGAPKASSAPKKRRRRPIKVSPTRPVRPCEYKLAEALLDRSGILPPLQQKLETGPGRRRLLLVKTLLMALIINALREGHRGHIRHLTQVVNSFSPSQRFALGLRDWQQANSYVRVDRLFNRITNALDEGFTATVNGSPTLVDADWVADRLTDASCPPDLLVSSSVAVDGTDLPTYARLHGEMAARDIDCEEEEDERPEDLLEAASKKSRRRKHTAKVLGLGQDGRKIYTADRQARAGWRTAKNKEPGRPYIGREMHLVTQARDVVSTDQLRKTVLGPSVARLIRRFRIVAAGTHRAKTVLPLLLGLRERGHLITDVLADGGYTLAKLEYFLLPLHDAGVHVTFKPASHQRSPKPFSEDAILLDGQLFSSAVPEELEKLPMPPWDTTGEERARYVEAFERRAAYRYSLHAGPDPDGYTRWKGPFAAGRLLSRQLPETMRGPRDKPLVRLREGTRPAATITVSARALPLRQDLTVGTGAWFTSYSRRNIVESVNGALKGDFVDMDEKFFRVVKDADAKITFLAAFTIAGYNHHETEGFREQEALNAEGPPKKTRSRRRKDTFRDILGTPEADSDERGPPGNLT